MKRFCLILLLTCVSLCFVGCFSSSDSETTTNYYIGETMLYDDIEVTVNGLSEKQITTGENAGLYELIVSVTMKNNRNKDFDLNYADTYIKTQERGQKYEISVKFSEILGDIIISGASKNYEMKFYTPYSYKNKNFIIVFDWGLLNLEKEYNLFMRDGSVYSGNFVSEDEKYKDTVREIRDLIYDEFKKNIYDNIKSGMYYSDVQYLVDYFENIVAQEIMGFYIYLDLSNGSYHPLWVGRLQGSSQTHNLFFLKLDMSSSFKWEKKYIGIYEI